MDTGGCNDRRTGTSHARASCEVRGGSSGTRVRRCSRCTTATRPCSRGRVAGAAHSATARSDKTPFQKESFRKNPSKSTFTKPPTKHSCAHCMGIEYCWVVLSGLLSRRSPILLHQWSTGGSSDEYSFSVRMDCCFNLGNEWVRTAPFRYLSWMPLAYPRGIDTK